MLVELVPMGGAAVIISRALLPYKTTVWVAVARASSHNIHEKCEKGGSLLV